MEISKNNDNCGGISKLSSLNNINYLIGTVITGDNIHLFTNIMDLTIFDDYRNSSKNYDDYDLVYAIPLLLYDIDIVAKEVVLVNSMTWNLDDNVNFTIDLAYDNKLVGGVILIENSTNNVNYMKGVRKSDIISESTDNGNMIYIDRYYNKLVKLTKIINELKIKYQPVISFDNINWLDLVEFTSTNKHIDINIDMNNLSVDVDCLQFANYRAMLTEKFNHK